MIAETALYPGVRGGERTVHLRAGGFDENWYAHRPGYGTVVIGRFEALSAAEAMRIVWIRWPDCSIEMINP